MKKIYAFVFMYMLAVAAFAQQPSFLWANGFGGPAGVQPAGDEYACKFVADDSGNVFVLGHFTGTVDFDPGPGVSSLTSAGDSDIFLAYYRRNGELIWEFRIGGPGPDDGLGIFKHNELLYITGSFSGDSVQFDPILTPGTYLSSNGAKDIFIAKFDTTGYLFWATSIGGTGIDVANSIAVDDSGNVLLTGSFSGNVDFDPGPGVINLNTGGTPPDGFIAKYTEAGTVRWAFDFGGGTTPDVGLDITTDDSGFVYVTGQFTGGNIDFDPDTPYAYLNAAGNFDAFVASYTYNGKYRWAFSFGSNFQDKSDAIALDTAGNVLVTGRFSGLVDFDPGPATHTLNTPAGSDMFYAKYDNLGNYIWANQIGSSANEEGLDIIANPYSGFVMVTGYFNGTVDFNPTGAVANLTSAGAEDVFVAAYDPSGGYVWAFNVGGPAKDVGTCLLAFPDVNADSILLYVGGNFASTADFDPSLATANLTSMGGQDVFVAEYYDPFPVGIKEISSATMDFHMYPNPAQSVLHVVFDEILRESDLRITDLNGRMVQHQRVSGKSVQLDVSGMDAGIYIVSLEGRKGISHAMFTVVK